MSVIDLDKPRIIPITDRGTKYTLTVGVITKAQWLRYFDGIVSTSENQQGKLIEVYDARSARLELAETALIDATGYVTGDNASVTAREHWQQLLPMSHRLAVADALVAVSRDADTDDAPIQLGSETVVLRARWGADASGAMQEYSGLRHLFHTPTAEHQRRYQRAISSSMIVGGSRTSKTQWLGAQSTLIDLYDELIESTEGYAVGSDEPTDRASIISSMDSYHKVAAAEQLFAPALPELAEEK
jgi:hypothetical protein